jgi:hypothetical protein
MLLVRKGGIEPPRVLPHRILNPARLPIPPLSPVNQSPLSFHPYVTWGSEDCQDNEKPMSKILVVEPQRILQQAMILSLFPQHDVELAADVSENGTPDGKGFDLVIIDAAALRDANALRGSVPPVAQEWKLPTIWIQDGGGPPAPSGGRIVVVKRPIQKDALQSAIAECLADSSTSKRKASRSVPDQGVPGSSKNTTKKVRTASRSESPSARVIELVDVVEAESEYKDSAMRQKKTK